MRDQREHEAQGGPAQPLALDGHEREDAERFGQRAGSKERLVERERHEAAVVVRHQGHHGQGSPVPRRRGATGEGPEGNPEQGLQGQHHADFGVDQAERVEHGREQRREDAVAILGPELEEQVARHPLRRQVKLRLTEIDLCVVPNPAVRAAQDIEGQYPDDTGERRPTSLACNDLPMVVLSHAG
jgi:hypothetical protein